MTRRHPLRRRKSLTRRARLRSVSQKRQAGRAAFARVYATVDRRAGGRCEVPWCRSWATDHHHTVKPRARHHRVELVIHLCRPCHEATERPYLKGRLLIAPFGDGRFGFAIGRAADKWAARSA